MLHLSLFNFFFRPNHTAICPSWIISSSALKIDTFSLAEFLPYISGKLARKSSPVLFLHQLFKSGECWEKHEQISLQCKLLNWTKWKKSWFQSFGSGPNKNLSLMHKWQQEALYWCQRTEIPGFVLCKWAVCCLCGSFAEGNRQEKVLWKFCSHFINAYQGII